MFALLNYPTPSGKKVSGCQKKFQDAYENWGVKREKRIIFSKLNIKDDNVYIYIYIYTITIKIFKSQKKFKKMSTPF